MVATLQAGQINKSSPLEMAAPLTRADSASPLARLPHAVVQSIFAFALALPERMGPVEGVPVELKAPASVCREWNRYAHDVTASLTLGKLVLDDLRVEDRQEILELRRSLVLRRAFLRELEIRDAKHFSSDSAFPLSVDQWCAITVQLPVLEELNLKYVSRDYPSRLAAIVRAARKQCLRLKAIALPSLRPTRFGRATEGTEDTQLLISATLEGKSRDLRRLTFPLAFTDMQTRHETSKAYLTKICEATPCMEVLDGYTAFTLASSTDQLVCDEQWFIDEATWSRFCETINNLKSFDWIVAPFMTSFFEVLGRFSKPRLEKLVFSTPMNWDWDQYFLDLGRPRPSSGYGGTAHAVLKACPALRQLEVAVYLPGDGASEDEDDEFGWDAYGAIPSQRVPLPDHPMMDQEIFGDEFCEAVARHCKKLEKFTIWLVLEASTVQHTIMSFTDRAIEALATLQELRWVELKSVNITSEGLFTLVACFTPHGEFPRLQREFEITVGDEESRANSMAFYSIVEEFLKKLLACDALSCADSRVALRLHNGNFGHVDRTWSKEYLERVGSLAVLIKAKHPTVQLRILTRRYDRSTKSCAEVIEFGFFTKSTELNVWWGWENERQDTRVDDFVVCRGDLHTEGTRAPFAPSRLDPESDSESDSESDLEYMQDEDY